MVAWLIITGACLNPAVINIVIIILRYKLITIIYIIV
jgi:hypothetical protein